MGSEADSGTSRLRMCLTRSVPSRVPDSAAQVESPPRLPRTAVALYLLGVLSYFGTLLVDPEHVIRYGEISLIPRAILVSVLAIILQVVAVTVTAFDFVPSYRA